MKKIHFVPNCTNRSLRSHGHCAFIILTHDRVFPAFSEFLRFLNKVQEEIPSWATPTCH